MGRRSIVVARVLTAGVRRYPPIQHARVELKPLFSFCVGRYRCDKTAFIELFFFSLTTLFAQTTLTLRCAASLSNGA